MALPNGPICFGPYELYLDTHELRRLGERVEIQRKPMEILTYLARRRDRVVSVEELLQAVWKGVAVTPGVVTSAIKSARAAVGDSGSDQYVIRTRHRYGYQFVAGSPSTEGASSLVRSRTHDPDRALAGADEPDDPWMARLAREMAEMLIPVIEDLCAAEVERALRAMADDGTPAADPGVSRGARRPAA